MKGIIGKKLGMTTIFDEDGKNSPCTFIECGPCTVTQVKTIDTDGYSAVQLGFDDKPEKNTTNALKGHFKKSETTPKRKVVEFRDYDFQKEAGDTVDVEMFEVGEIVAVSAQSKGKGFQGVVKRHGFGGVGMATHGQHNRMRAPGSIGMSSTPSRVMKGMRMAGRMGNSKVKTKGLEVLKVIPEKNLLVVKGNVAGHNGAYVIVQS